MCFFRKYDFVQQVPVHMIETLAYQGFHEVALLEAFKVALKSSMPKI